MKPALLSPCPNCQAKPGEPCTQPTNTARRPVRWYHFARDAEARREEEG